MHIAPIPLQGRFVRLEPVTPALKDELQSALDVDPASWSILSTAGYGEHFDGWWNALIHDAVRGDRIAYAARRIVDGRLIRTSSFLEIKPAHRIVEIGATFIAPEARGGTTNPEMKLMLLQHAFDAGAVRVQLVTDGRNLRSQAAIEKLGAVREGVLRQHRITWTGVVRDTVVYSIIDAEWPAARERLTQRLSAIELQ